MPAPESPIYILGLSFDYHDAAAALIQDGIVIAAAQEERFTRKKHDASFPERSIQYCLDRAGIRVGNLSCIVYYEKPLKTFDRLIQTYIRTWPRGLKSFLQATLLWTRQKLWVEKRIRNSLKWSGDIFYLEHHVSHAASAYYASGFQEALVVTMDGVGEWDTATIGFGKGNNLTLTRSLHFPDSLGLLYSAVTYYLGFKVNSAEYKVMGLAPYGNPETYKRAFEELVDRKSDGSFQLCQKFFSYRYGLRMTNKNFDALFGGPPRKPEAPITQKDKDLAATLQWFTEQIVLDIVLEAKRLHPNKNLCLAGGVALNCVANGKILKTGKLENVFIQPAAGDAGGAIGCALYVYYQLFGNSLLKIGRPMEHAYLGPEFTSSEIESALRERGLIFHYVHDEEILVHEVASYLLQSNVIGWFQGRMEFGPRALGNRSILADPRKKENWQRVNLKIKFRESFRPFAPSVLEEQMNNWFQLNHPSPFMLFVAPVTRDTIPAVTHVDGSARIHSVAKNDNPRYHALLQAFYQKTNCPILINTSFNVRGEPIVCSPQDAIQCFLNTDMDYLVLGNYIVSKSANPQALTINREKYLGSFPLD